MSRQRVQAGLVLTVFIASAALLATVVMVAAISLTSDDIAGSGHPAENVTAAAASGTNAPSAPVEPQLPAPVATLSSAAKTPIAIQLAVGDCVVADGDGEQVTVEKTTCGSGPSSYKIFDKAPAGGTCPTDTDQTYSERVGSVEQGGLCMDIDWVVGGCLELGEKKPTHIDCATGGTTEGVKVLEVKHGVADANQCESGNLGFVYNQRKFVVCVARL
ncbi:LppU family putative lipoprotein [Nocardia sp. NPDC055029]